MQNNLYLPTFSVDWPRIFEGLRSSHVPKVSNLRWVDQAGVSCSPSFPLTKYPKPAVPCRGFQIQRPCIGRLTSGLLVLLVSLGLDMMISWRLEVAKPSELTTNEAICPAFRHPSRLSPLIVGDRAHAKIAQKPRRLTSILSCCPINVPRLEDVGLHPAFHIYKPPPYAQTGVATTTDTNSSPHHQPTFCFLALKKPQ